MKYINIKLFLRKKYIYIKKKQTHVYYNKSVNPKCKYRSLDILKKYLKKN